MQALGAGLVGGGHGEALGLGAGQLGHQLVQKCGLQSAGADGAQVSWHTAQGLVDVGCGVAPGVAVLQQ